MMHPGMPKFFRNISIAAHKVEERAAGREKLQGYLQKIKLVSSQSAKKSVISGELQKLEKHIETMLDKKLHTKSETEHQKQMLSALKEKEHDLNTKIAKVNELLAKLGKKVDEEELKEKLAVQDKKKSVVEQLEEKLYVLEQKFHELSEDPNCLASSLLAVRDKISVLKEKIREVKSRDSE